MLSTYFKLLNIATDDKNYYFLFVISTEIIKHLVL